MDFSLDSLVGSFVGFVSAGLVAVIGYFGLARKTKSEETEIILNAWKDLIQPLQDQLIEAKEEIAALKEHNKITEKRHSLEVQRLTKRIRELENKSRDLDK